MGEFELIERIKAQFKVPEGITGIGDDCAVIPQKEGFETLFTTDLLIDGVHFILGKAAPFDLGWKSAAVNISDIAAMGGRPVGAFLSIALPQGLDSSWTDRFIEGFAALSEKFGCPLLGGDTSASKVGLCINVGVIGECKAGCSKKRNMAEPGDLVCTTGVLGDSATGLKFILDGCPAGSEMEKYLIQRHYRPLPRVEAGLVLATVTGVHAMMDISDGIGSDLRHILKASGVSAEIDVAAVPKSPQMLTVCEAEGWSTDSLAICGGEDYELLFTVAPDAFSGAESGLRKAGCECHRIGRITAGEAGQIEWLGSETDFRGFTHF